MLYTDYTYKKLLIVITSLIGLLTWFPVVWVHWECSGRRLRKTDT